MSSCSQPRITVPPEYRENPWELVKKRHQVLHERIRAQRSCIRAAS